MAETALKLKRVLQHTRGKYVTQNGYDDHSKYTDSRFTLNSIRPKKNLKKAKITSSFVLTPMLLWQSRIANSLKREPPRNFQLQENKFNLIFQNNFSEYLQPRIDWCSF